MEGIHETYNDSSLRNIFLEKNYSNLNQLAKHLEKQEEPVKIQYMIHLKNHYNLFLIMDLNTSLSNFIC